MTVEYTYSVYHSVYSVACCCLDKNLISIRSRKVFLKPFILSGSVPQTLFNPNKTVVKMFVVMYNLRAMPAGHQTFLRQRTFSVPVRRDANNQINRKPLSLGQGRTLRYLIHLRWHGRFTTQDCFSSYVCLFCANLSLSHRHQVPELKVWKALPTQRHPSVVLQEVHGGGQRRCLRAPVLHRVSHRPSIFSSLLKHPSSRPSLKLQPQLEASTRLWSTPSVRCVRFFSFFERERERDEVQGQQSTSPVDLCPKTDVPSCSSPNKTKVGSTWSLRDSS